MHCTRSMSINWKQFKLIYSLIFRICCLLTHSSGTCDEYTPPSLFGDECLIGKIGFYFCSCESHWKKKQKKKFSSIFQFYDCLLKWNQWNWNWMNTISLVSRRTNYSHRVAVRVVAIQWMWSKLQELDSFHSSWLSWMTWDYRAELQCGSSAALSCRARFNLKFLQDSVFFSLLLLSVWGR